LVGSPETASTWTPNQASTIRDLLGMNQALEAAGPRPSFPEDLRSRLRGSLESLLAGLSEEVTSERPVRVTKYELTTVLRCEGYADADRDVAFEWSPQKLRGRLVHRALQATVTRAARDLAPTDLVEQALALVRADDQDVDLYLSTCSPVEVAELVTIATNAVVAFAADWPPLRPSMIPRIESSANVRLLGERVELRGKYDLALGRPGRDPAEVVIVDLKTGSPSAEHPAEVAYYALLETLKNGVPPFRVASYYLDESRFVAHDVTEDLLESALRRTAAGVARLAAIWNEVRGPELTPGPHCRFCPATECEVRQR
jgi:hypothetical protein